MVEKEDVKILIIEDEIIVALDIKSALESMDYKVTDIVTNYNEAIKSVDKNPPHIVLSDIKLEKSTKDGIDTAKDIQQRSKTPIIYLSAYCDDDTINRAVETNPVGYLTKPFKREELKSTIALGLYRIKNAKEETKSTYVNVGFDYFYDEETLNLYYKEKEIPLSQKEKLLFSILFKNKGEIVPFETIEFQIWDDNVVSNSTLRTLLYRLRSKLNYNLVKTVHQQGVKLIDTEQNSK